MAKKRQILISVPKQLFSRKVMNLLLDDFSFFGSVPFYVFVTFIAFMSDNMLLSERLVYGFLISFLAIVVIKKIHYKDRPQKEEFTIFMERMIASSFPSSHALVITMISIFVYLSFPFLWVMCMAFALWVLVCFQRYLTKKHYLMDILGGTVLAIVIAIFVIRVL